jgi:hypothetical protein
MWQKEAKIQALKVCRHVHPRFPGQHRQGGLPLTGGAAVACAFIGIAGQVLDVPPCCIAGCIPEPHGRAAHA